MLPFFSPLLTANGFPFFFIPSSPDLTYFIRRAAAQCRLSCPTYIVDYLSYTAWPQNFSGEYRGMCSRKRGGVDESDVKREMYGQRLMLAFGATVFLSSSLSVRNEVIRFCGEFFVSS